jgi:lipopolysaccharide cholinephosphotransferase
MTDEKTRNLQLKILDIMRILHEVCVRHNIEYYMISGTLLGAVRHKGFIPWDDDMDIGIPRKDYEKLISLPLTEWPENIEIKTPYNSNDLVFPYSKIMDKTTTIVEDRLDGIVEGVYIDIFPLDGAGNSFPYARYRYFIFDYKIRLLYNNQDYGKKKHPIKRIFQLYAKSKNTKKLYQSLEKSMRKVEFSKSKIIGNYSSAWRFKEFFERKNFEGQIFYKFEGLDLYGPKNAHDYLTKVYGDYLILPPKAKRKSHHKFLYLNLNLPYSDYLRDNSNRDNKK